MAAIPGIMVDIGANVARMQQDMRKLTGTMESGFGQMASFAKKAAGAIGIAFGIREVVNFGKEVLAAGDRLNKMSQSVGVSVETLSSLKYAAELADVDLQSLATGLGKLSRNMFDAQGGVGEAKDAIKALGLTIEDTRGSLLSSDKVMSQVADKFAAMEDGSTKTALAIKIFGKSGADLIPLLNQGSSSLAEMRAEAEKLGLVMSTETAQQMERVNDNFTRMKSAVEGVALSIVVPLLPTLENLTNILISLKNNSAAFTNIGEGLAIVLKSVASAALVMTTALSETLHFLETMGAQIHALSLGNIREGIKAWENYSKSSTKTWSEMGVMLEKIWSDAATNSEKGSSQIKKSLDIKLDAKPITDPMQSIIDKLFAEVEALQMGENALELYKLGLHEAKAEQREYALYLLASINAQKLFKTSVEEMAKSEEIAILANYDAWKARKDQIAKMEGETLDLFPANAQALAKSEEIAILENYENLIKNRQAVADAEANQMQKDYQILVDFADRVRSQNRMTADYAIEQIEKQAAIFKKAGADEVAVAIWAAKEKQKASREWQDGAIRGLEEYAADATNAAKNTEEAFARGFKSMEDALVDFVKTGKLNFKSLVDSIISDLLRLMIRQQITGPLANLLGSGLSSLFGSGSSSWATSSLASQTASVFHGGGVVGDSVYARNIPAIAFAGAPRFHSGLKPDEFPTILKRGEGVFTPEQMAAMGGRTNISISIPVNMPDGDARKAGQMRRELENELEPLVRRIVERYA